MKHFALAALLIASLTLIGCASNSTPANINGSWNATLMSNGNGTPVFTFATSLSENGDGSLTISNFSFSTNSSCFVTGETESGSFTLSGTFTMTRM